MQAPHQCWGTGPAKAAQMQLPSLRSWRRSRPCRAVPCRGHRGEWDRRVRLWSVHHPLTLCGSFSVGLNPVFVSACRGNIFRTTVGHNLNGSLCCVFPWQIKSQWYFQPLKLNSIPPQRMTGVAGYSCVWYHEAKGWTPENYRASSWMKPEIPCACIKMMQTKNPGYIGIYIWSDKVLSD